MESSSERGKAWKLIADKLSKIRSRVFVSTKSLSGTTTTLVDRYKKNIREELNSSGINPEPSERDSMLEKNVERKENAADEKENFNS